MKWLVIGTFGLFAITFLTITLTLFILQQDAQSTAEQASETAAEVIAPVNPNTEPTVDTTVLDYADKVSDHTSTIREATNEVFALLQDAQFDSETWRIDAETHLVLIRSAHLELIDVEPPSGLYPIHSDLILGTGACYEATDFVALGIDEQDMEHIERAHRLVEDCNEKIRDSMVDVNREKAQRQY